MKIKKLNSISQFLIYAGIFAVCGSSTPLFADTNSLSKIEKEITELQETLFNPEKSQIAVLVSVNKNISFKLDSISFYIDNKKAKTYFYTKRESDALLKNAMQKIYVGNISEGEHTIKAHLSTVGKNKQNYKISASSKLIKTNTTKYVELKISKSEQPDSPTLNIKIWE